jgi:hypothetical protein
MPTTTVANRANVGDSAVATNGLFEIKQLRKNVASRQV